MLAALMVKRVIVCATVAVIALLAAVAAPALTLHTYRPDAVDFELSPASGALHGAGGGYVSPQLRAPKRFDLVGMRWRGRSRPKVSVRVRRDGARWSRWTALEVDPGDAPDPAEGSPRGLTAPLWTGDADYLQYRLSRPVPGLRIHFVNSTGTATAGDRARTAIRRAANGGVIAAARLLSLGSVAHAQSAAPSMVPRSSWNGGNCPPRRSPEYGEVDMAFVHHTDTINGYSPSDSPAMVLAICRYHRNSNGWNDIGYNFLADQYGTIFEGRAGGIDRPVVGAHAQGFNAQSTGVAILGTFNTFAAPDAALRAVARLLRWKLPASGQPTTGTATLTSAGGSDNRFKAGRQVTFQRIAGHRDADSTDCPGDALYAQLPELRQMVGSYGPGARSHTSLALFALPKLVQVPGTATVTGRLALRTGAPVAGAVVEIQRFGGSVWRTVATATTGGDGTFSATVAPSSNGLLRAHFPGDSSRFQTASRRASLRVRPEMELSLSATHVKRGGTVKASGTIKPAKRRVTMVLLLGKKRVASFAVRPHGGAYAKHLRLKKPGLYRVYGSFGGDASNVAAASRAVYVRAR
ncbi:MAG: N-acetylmuramoyl-L-alanine amidase [Gaiellaceae bacterium]